MSSGHAETATIRRLFAAYSKQGIKKDKAIMLIAEALGLGKKQVFDVLKNDLGDA
jgi:hypothetical protein